MGRPVDVKAELLAEVFMMFIFGWSVVAPLWKKDTIQNVKYSSVILLFLCWALCPYFPFTMEALSMQRLERFVVITSSKEIHISVKAVWYHRIHVLSRSTKSPRTFFMQSHHSTPYLLIANLSSLLKTKHRCHAELWCSVRRFRSF